MSIDRLTRRAFITGAAAFLAVPLTEAGAKPQGGPEPIPASCINPNQTINTRGGAALFSQAVQTPQQWFDNKSRVTHTDYSFGFRWALAEDGALYRSEVKDGGYQPFAAVNRFDFNVTAGVLVNNRSRVLVAGNKLNWDVLSSQPVVALAYENCPSIHQLINLPFPEGYIMETARLGQENFILNMATPDVLGELSIVDPTASSTVTRLRGTQMYRLKATTQSGGKASIYGVGLPGSSVSPNAGLLRYDLDLPTKRISSESLSHLDWPINDLAIKFNRFQPDEVESVYGLDTLNGRVFVSYGQNEFSYYYDAPLHGALQAIYKAPVETWMDSIAVTEDRVWLGGAMLVDQNFSWRSAQGASQSLRHPLSPFEEYRQLRAQPHSKNRQAAQLRPGQMVQLLLASYPRYLAPDVNSFNFNLVATDPTYRSVNRFSLQGLRQIDTLGFTGMEAVVLGDGVALIETTSGGNQYRALAGALYPNRGIAGPSTFIPIGQ